MVLICHNNGVCGGATSNSVNLTIGKKYYINYFTGKEYQLVNDRGDTCYYHKNRFTSIEKWRESQLNKIV
jgi:hypothetical protein